jgi:hypothetical protein
MVAAAVVALALAIVGCCCCFHLLSTRCFLRSHSEHRTAHGRRKGGQKYMCLTAREFETAEAAPELDYGVTYCPHLFIFLIAMTYSFISPIIIPFAACYFVLGWLVFKYQLVHVFVQRFESGGTFWPVVYSKMSTSLLIAQLCLVGIFGLKEVPAQAVLVVPMPILTLLFDRYVLAASLVAGLCRRRWRPPTDRLWLGLHGSSHAFFSFFCFALL